jgi:hypothetical protein
MNGTSKEQLVEQQREVILAAQELYYRLTQASPNGRDFYPAGPDAINRAIEEHRRKVRAVLEIMNEAESLAFAIAQQ